MNLIDLSDNSFKRINDCLKNDDPTTTWKFSTTCFRISQWAEKCGMNKLETSAIGLEYYDRQRYLAFQIFEKQPISDDPYFWVETDIWYTHSVYVGDNEEKRARKAKELLRRFLKRIKSSDGLVLLSITIDSEMVQIFQEFITWPVEVLVIRDCNFEISEQQFHGMMLALKVKSLTTEDRLKNLRLNTAHLSLISNFIVILGFHHQQRCFPLSDIDDQLLTNWLYNTPKQVRLDHFATRITVKGLLNFIESLTDKLNLENDGKSYLFNLGIVKTDNDFEWQLIMRQRQFGLDWDVYYYKDENINGAFCEVTCLDEKVTFEFIIEKQGSKITKEQARFQILELNAEIRRKSEEDPENYRARHDRDATSKIRQISLGIYDEWDDMRLQLFRLLYGEAIEAAQPEEEDD